MKEERFYVNLLYFLVISSFYMLIRKFVVVGCRLYRDFCECNKYKNTMYVMNIFIVIFMIFVLLYFFFASKSSFKPNLQKVKSKNILSTLILLFFFTIYIEVIFCCSWFSANAQ